MSFYVGQQVRLNETWLSYAWHPSNYRRRRQDIVMVVKSVRGDQVTVERPGLFKRTRRKRYRETFHRTFLEPVHNPEIA